MQVKSKYNFITAAMVLVSAAFTSCEKDPYELPVAPEGLQNDAIKRSLGPNIVGQQIEFAYAMAIKGGKINEARVEASVAGATGTYLENNSYFTDGSGNDIPRLVGSPSVTSGATTTVTFNKDTAASTLRYFYVIPEEARGKTVSFKFSATSSNNQAVNFDLGPYTISKMDVKRNLAVNATAAYISIEDMAVYNAAGAAANAGKIDLVYLFRNTNTSAFNHAIVSPAADPVYLPGITLPSGVNRSSKIRKVFNLQDYDLAQRQFGIYVDDRDFLEINLA
ncbi:MAG: DUF4466 domain-containing protein, partial [Sphingobacteriales bacterium]